MGVKKDRDIVDYSSCFCVFGHFLSKDDVRYLRIINKNGVEKISMNEAALPQSTVHIAQADPDGILLVIHAGAGNRGKKDTPERRAQVEQDLNRALEAG